MSEKKDRCYSSDCKLKWVGFQWDSWPVCTLCKCELGPDLVSRLEVEAETKKERKKRDDPNDGWIW